MTFKALTFLLAAPLLLTACIDKWYPNQLSGTVKEGAYTNHARVGRLASFDTYQVQVPQSYNTYQTQMLHANEVIAKDYTYVSFGPALTDHSIYRVMIIDKKQ